MRAPDKMFSLMKLISLPRTKTTLWYALPRFYRNNHNRYVRLPKRGICFTVLSEPHKDVT